MKEGVFGWEVKFKGNEDGGCLNFEVLIGSRIDFSVVNGLGFLWGLFGFMVE